MTVVSDASPLICLARIDALHLLGRLYGRILAPTEVYNEVVVDGAGLPGALELSRADWIEVCSLKDSVALVELIRATGLGRGEAAAILRGKERSIDLMIIDEARARGYAKETGLNLIGTIGILEVLYRRGDIADLRDAFLKLLKQKVRLSPRMLQASLASFNLPPI